MHPSLRRELGQETVRKHPLCKILTLTSITYYLILIAHQHSLHGTMTYLY